MSALDPRRIAAGLVNLPTGVVGSRQLLPALGLVDRLRGRTLEQAVSGRTVLITGASSGIGAATAVMVGAAGGEVVLVARREEQLRDVAARVAEQGGRAYVQPADLTDEEEIDRLAAEVQATHGRVDVLVNNAGRSIRRSVERAREHDFERTMSLNYLAPVRLILAFLPGMREAGRGHVLNVSSASVKVRTPRFAAYTASKAALDAFTDCVAAETAHHGIRFTTISMPLVRTPMIAPTEIYRSFPSISAEQAAERICAGIVHRPRRIGSAYGDLVAAIDAINPAAMEAIRNRGYRMFPESGRDAETERTASR